MRGKLKKWLGSVVVGFEQEHPKDGQGWEWYISL